MIVALVVRLERYQRVFSSLIPVHMGYSILSISRIDLWSQGIVYPGYQRFFLACDEELRRS